MKHGNGIVAAVLLLVCAVGPGRLQGQAEPATKVVKKDEPAKTEAPPAKAGLSVEGEKKLAAQMAAFLKERDAAVEKEKAKEPLKGYLTMAMTGLDKNRVIGINNISGLYRDDKISKRTVLVILMDKIKDPFPRTSTTAFNKLREISAQNIDNNLSLWGTWWAEQEKREEDAKLAEFTAAIEAAEGQTGTKEPKEEPKVKEDPEKAKEKAETEEPVPADPEAGKRQLIGEHNASLGFLDRIRLKNGREPNS